MCCKDDYSITIRPSTEADIIGVQQVFRDGAFSNILPAFKLDLQKKAFHYFVVIAQGVMVAVLQTAAGLVSRDIDSSVLPFSAIAVRSIWSLDVCVWTSQVPRQVCTFT